MVISVFSVIIGSRNKIQAIIFMILMESKKRRDLFLSLFSKYIHPTEKRESKNKKK